MNVSNSLTYTHLTIKSEVHKAFVNLEEGFGRDQFLEYIFF